MRLPLLWFALSISFIAHGEEVTWAGKNPLVDQWKDDIAKMRAARKPQPLPGYLFSERVLWVADHDSGGAELADKRRLMLVANEAQTNAINQWEKGKVLVLCYDEERGVTLLDPESNVQVSVRHITDRHPIDDYSRSLNAQTTLGMLAAGEETQRLWRLEIDRSVREVLAFKYLPKEDRENFIKLSKSRLDYLEQQSKFATSAVYATYSPGTICGPLSTEEIVALYRAASFQLSGLYEYYRTYGEKPEGR